METERTGTVGVVFGDRRTWTVRCGVWRQKEHGQWGGVFVDRKNRDSEVGCLETEGTWTVGGCL